MSAGARTGSSTIAVLVCACAAASGCSGGRAGVDAAAAALARHRPAFADLDRGVRRAMQGAERLGNERSLAGTLFARARAEPSLRAAWVVQASNPPVVLSMPRDTPPPAVSTALRVRDPQLGAVEVIASAPCPPRESVAGAKPSKGAPPPEGRCVFVARSAPGPRGSLRVTAAFEDSTPAAP